MATVSKSSVGQADAHDASPQDSLVHVPVPGCENYLACGVGCACVRASLPCFLFEFSTLLCEFVFACMYWMEASSCLEFPAPLPYQAWLVIPDIFNSIIYKPLLFQLLYRFASCLRLYLGGSPTGGTHTLSLSLSFSLLCCVFLCVFVRSCRHEKGILFVALVNSVELIVYIFCEDQYLYNNCNNVYAVVSNIFCISNTILFMLNLVCSGKFPFPWTLLPFLSLAALGGWVGSLTSSLVRPHQDAIIRGYFYQEENYGNVDTIKSSKAQQRRDG